MSFRELEWSILNFWHSGTGGMRASGIGQSFAMIHLSSWVILNHKRYLCQLRNRKKTMEWNPSSVSSQHKSWSLQGQTRLYRSPTSCKVLLLLIAARCTSSSCADHIAKVLTPSPHRAQHLSWGLSCRFHHRPLAYKYNGGWRTAEACVACTRTKVPQHWEEEEKRRKKKRRRKGEATLRLPCCVLYSQWHYLTP